MKGQHLARRVRGVLCAPRRTWAEIATERTTVTALYRDYVVWLAALPAVCGFVRGSIIGYSSAAFATARVGLANGAGRMILGYLISLVMVYLMGLIVDGLAPSFGAQRDARQAFKTVAYACTAFWIASIGELLPVISPLVLTAGAGYSIWLLFVGLQHAMQTPRRRAPAYTAVTVLSAVLISISFLVLRAGILAATLRFL